MSLRRRALILALAAAAVFLVGLVTVLRLTVLRAFEETERRGADDALSAVHRALTMSSEDLDARMVDWADWDDAAAFAAAGGDEFERSNLGITSMRSVEWHLFAVWSPTHGFRALRYADRDFHAFSEVPDAWRARLTAGGALLRGTARDGPPTHGFAVVNGEVWLVSSRAIRRSDQSPGATPTRMVVGRRFSDRWVQRIRRLTRVDVTVSPRPLPAGTPRVLAINAHSLRGALALRDLDGAPTLSATATMPRTARAQFDTLFRAVVLSIMALAALVGVLASWQIQRVIVRPLRRLSVIARQLGQGVGERASEYPVEELDTLGRAFNAMADEVQRRTESLRLANEALVTSNATAQAALAARGAFLATMSHEIRTPMNGVLGMAQLLEDSGLEGERLEWVRTLRRAGEALLTVLNDVLDLSKIEAGRLEVERLPFDLRAVLRESVRLFTPGAQQAGITLRCDLDGLADPAVRGDPTRVRQVLANLVGNAVKFTHRGEVVLSARRTDDDRVRITLRDTGIGMTPEVLARLFEPFSQADHSFARRYGGTGLGLAISSRLAQLMGGRLSATSEAGVGSEFTLELPLPPCDDVAPSRQTRLPAPAPRPSARATPARGRVLAAEDNEVNRKLLQRFLQRLGFEAVLVNDGAAAVEAVAREDFDAVLMDCQMPEVDGFEATARIRRAQPVHLRVPIIALTANAMQGDRERCLAAGMDDYLTKPLRVQELEETLVRWIPDAARRTVGA
jgi:signal transduction histidine kinase/ActR/RegA family two-component response regulator